MRCKALLRLALASLGRAWPVQPTMARCSRLWLAMVGYGRLWLVLAMLGQLSQSLPFVAVPRWPWWGMAGFGGSCRVALGKTFGKPFGKPFGRAFGRPCGWCCQAFGWLFGRPFGQPPASYRLAMPVIWRAITGHGWRWPAMTSHGFARANPCD